MLKESIFFFSFCFILPQPFTRDIIEQPFFYKNEICSYNGIPKAEGNKIFCECYDSYIDEPDPKNYKYIAGERVHCSYQKKKRFKTFFLAGILPMGFDYYYLGHTKYFVLIALAFIIFVANNIIEFYLSYHLNEKPEESKYKDNEREINNNYWYKSNKSMDKNYKAKKCLNIYNIINKITLILFILYWIVDIILQAKGLIKDSNGIETDNDMDVLFNREDI